MTWVTGTRFAFWAAVSTAVLAAASFGVAITTPPRSGPFCTASCIVYPYTSGASFVPRDYLWMYPAILVPLAFVTLVASSPHYANQGNRVYGQIALCFGAIAAALIVADYFIQLTVIQPSLLKGESEGLSLFSQYNPHGVFIALEDAGYWVMSLAFLFLGIVIDGASPLERATRWILVTGSLVAIAALVGLALIYGKDLEYRFEVAVLSIDWLVLLVCGVMLGVGLRSRYED